MATNKCRKQISNCPSRCITTTSRACCKLQVVTFEGCFWAKVVCVISRKSFVVTLSRFPYTHDGINGTVVTRNSCWHNYALLNATICSCSLHCCAAFASLFVGMRSIEHDGIMFVCETSDKRANCSRVHTTRAQFDTCERAYAHDSKSFLRLHSLFATQVWLPCFTECLNRTRQYAGIIMLPRRTRRI